jgi:hypothetical protein
MAGRNIQKPRKRKKKNLNIEKRRSRNLRNEQMSRHAAKKVGISCI